MIVSLHLPKTAGTAFRLYVEANIGRRAAFSYAQEAQPQQPLQAVQIAQGASGAGEVRADLQERGVEFLHGHSVRGFSTAMPEAPVLTWMRAPLARLVSEYLHLRRHPQEGHALAQDVAAGRIEIPHFAELTSGVYRDTVADLEERPGPFAAFVVEEADAACAAFASVLGWRGRLPVRNRAPCSDAVEARGLVATHQDLIQGPLAEDQHVYEQWRAAWRLPTRDPSSGYAQACAALKDGPCARRGGGRLSLRRRLGVWRESLERGVLAR